MNDLFSVEGKTICVTGASSGIGRAMAKLLAENGARVVGVARREAALLEWRSETTGQTGHVVADIADLASGASVAKDVSSVFGNVDVLINAAGLNPRQHADEVTLERWQATLDINLGASFFLAQAMVSGMKAKGWGRIINFASLQSRRAFGSGIAYGASKGGVEQMTRAMAEAWSKDGITANAIAPGFFPTELTEAVFQNKQLSDKNAQQTCIGRNGTMADLEGPLMFLSSAASDYITGQVLFVDGGFTAK